MTLNEIFGAKESYQLPDKIMHALLSDNAVEYINAVRGSGYTDLRDYYQSDAGDRVKLKQDFTPDCVCEIVSRLMVSGGCLDMCAGTGSLGKAAARYGHTVHAQEFSERTIPFNLLDAALNGTDEILDEADCLRGTVAKSYEVHDGRVRICESKPVGKFQNVIMNPPYSMDFPDTDSYEFYGMHVPKSKADYGFVLQGLRHMEDEGRLIAVLPHGVLFRGQKEAVIRKYLVDKQLIYAVIGLPDNMFMNTSIPVFVLILQKGSRETLFIDASKEFNKRGKTNYMTEDHIRHVINAFNSRTDEERYCHVAALNEITGNDYNLNIPRYVDTFVPEPLPDIGSLLSDLEEIEKEERKTREDLYKTLGELVASPDEMKMIKRHRDLLKPKRENGLHQLTFEEYINDVSHKEN
jgi:type I restriction enzyme M protein